VPSLVATVAAASVLVIASRASQAFVVDALPRHSPRPRAGLSLAASASDSLPGASLLDELISTAGTASSDELAAKVDASFQQLTPDDLNALQARLAAAADDTKAQLELLTGCIQAAMEKRMAQAKLDLDSLLMSSGDIEANIRACLERQDSPLPIMAVLQMNIAKAKQDGQEMQERALTFIFAKMNAVLEERVPLASRVLMKMLSLEDRAARKALLREHLTPRAEEVEAASELTGAIVKLVADVESTYDSGERLKKTLELVRGVALDAGVVVGEVYGEEEQTGYTERLQPLFEALSRV